MSDKIRFNPQTYDELASKLKSLSSDLKSISDKTTTLAGSSAAKAVLSLTASGIFNLKGISRSFSYANAAGGLSAARSALRACSEEAEQLARSVAQAKNLFLENERALVNLESGSEASVTEMAGGFKASGAIESSLSQIRDLFERIRNSDAFNQAWDQLQQNRRKGDEAINKQKVFDESKSSIFEYGGDQGSPLSYVDDPKTEEKYRAVILKNTGKELSSTELREYLNKMYLEGCTYVSMTNIIMKSYEGRAEEFRKTFGYDMYAHGGKLNYDLLLVDIYSRTDNRSYLRLHGLEKLAPLSYVRYEFSGDEAYNRCEDLFRPNGSNKTQFAERFDMFAKQHNIVYTHQSVKITPENFSTYAEQGVVTVNFSPVIVYNENHEYVKVDYDAGHSATVTGATDDGMLIISSWGQKLYIDPKDYGFGWKRALAKGGKYQFTLTTITS